MSKDPSEIDPASVPMDARDSGEVLAVPEGPASTDHLYTCAWCGNLFAGQRPATERAQRYVAFKKDLGEFVADHIDRTGIMPKSITLLDFMTWVHGQTVPAEEL